MTQYRPGLRYDRKGPLPQRPLPGVPGGTPRPQSKTFVLPRLPDGAVFQLRHRDCLLHARFDALKASWAVTLTEPKFSDAQQGRTLFPTVTVLLRAWYAGRSARGWLGTLTINKQAFTADAANPFLLLSKLDSMFRNFKEPKS